MGSKTIIAGQGKWLKPELSLLIITLHMNVRWLPRLAGVKMKPIGSDA